jgi:ABC-type transporter Mla subunit MlaD
VKRGLRVQTQLAGITGQQHLSLDFLDPQRHPPLPFDWEPEYPYVPSAPSLASEIISNVQSLVANLDKADIQQLGQNLNALVVNLNSKLDQVPVAELSAEAMAVLKDARTTIERVDRVLAQAPIDETVHNLAAASARLDDLLADPALRRTVGDVSAVTARLRKIAENGELDRIVKNLDRTVQRADALLADNQYDVRGFVQDLRVTADNLRTLSEIVKRYPPGLLIGGPPQKVQLPKEAK